MIVILVQLLPESGVRRWGREEGKDSPRRWSARGELARRLFSPAPALRLHYCYCYWYTHRDPLRWREPPPLSCLTAGGIGSVYQKAFLTTPTGIFPEYSSVNPLENVKLLRDEQKRVYTCSLSCMQRKTNAIDHAKLCRNGYIARFWTIWNQEPYLVKCNKLHHLTRRPKVICAQSRLLSFIRHVLVQFILRQEHHSQPGAILE